MLLAMPTVSRKWLGFDIGASSGRAMLGRLHGGQLQIEELYRFANAPVALGGTLYWDVLALWGHIVEALRICARQGHRDLAGIGVDTWGVDFGLLGNDDRLLGNPFCYRDAITAGAVEAITVVFPAERLFQLTGLPPGRVTTLAQLVGLRREGGGARLRAADTLLMMPDLFRYFLCGDKAVERTVAGSSLLLNVRTGQWCNALLRRLNLPRRILPRLVEPGTATGRLRKELARETGLNEAAVVAVAGHDTAAAAAAVPFADDKTAFISAGTWSVLGVIRHDPITSREALRRGFVNEFGLNSMLFVRNLMGLYLFENLRRSRLRCGERLTYAGMIRAVSQVAPFQRVLDINAPVFFVSEDPMVSVNAHLRATGQKPLRHWAEAGRAIMEGLAFSHREAMQDLAALTSRAFRRICLVGGGSRNRLLCQMTADATGLEVLAGPAEATVVGNLAIQALAVGHLRNAAAIRALVRRSFVLRVFKPRSADVWSKPFARYMRAKKTKERR